MNKISAYRNISTSFWTDAKVDDSFTPEDKYFYLYLLTNPHTNLCGCYELGNKQVERETGYNFDTITRLLDRMENVHGVIKYNKEYKEVLLLNWGKYNWYNSEKTKKGVIKVAKYIKTPEFRQYVIDSTDIRLQKTDTDTDTEVCMGYGYPMHTPSIPYTKNKFNKFPQNDYNFDNYEKNILNN